MIRGCSRIIFQRSDLTLSSVFHLESQPRKCNLTLNLEFKPFCTFYLLLIKSPLLIGSDHVLGFWFDPFSIFYISYPNVANGIRWDHTLCPDSDDQPSEIRIHPVVHYHTFLEFQLYSFSFTIALYLCCGSFSSWVIIRRFCSTLLHSLTFPHSLWHIGQFSTEPSSTYNFYGLLP